MTQRHHPSVCPDLAGRLLARLEISEIPHTVVALGGKGSPPRCHRHPIVAPTALTCAWTSSACVLALVNLATLDIARPIADKRRAGHVPTAWASTAISRPVRTPCAHWRRTANRPPHPNDVAADFLVMGGYSSFEPFRRAIAASAQSATTSKTTPTPVIAIIAITSLDIAHFNGTGSTCKPL